MVITLALLLAAAALWDIRTRRIPNGITAAGTAAGFLGHFWLGGASGLLWSLAGLAAALPLLLLYAARAFGAGDVKLLMAVGALMGPVFLLWTLLGAIFAGGLTALAWVVLCHAQTCRQVKPCRRMPFAPTIALGGAIAFAHLHGRLP